MKRVRDDTILKLSDIDHVLQSGDFYIGQSIHTECHSVDRLVYDREIKRVSYKNVNYPFGLLKIFDEGLVNASDNIKRGNNTDHIKVELHQINGTIKIWNNGYNFPIRESKYDTLVQGQTGVKALQPEVAFFHCKTSTAYNKRQKVTGGKFGLGAKLISIMSLWCKIKMCDGVNTFTQKVSNNMKVVHAPVVKKVSKKDIGKHYIQVEFKPDLTLFYPKGKGVTKFEKDVFDMFITRVFDIAGTTKKGTKVSLKIDDEPMVRVPVKNFKDYVKLFIPIEQVPDLDKKTSLPKIGYYENERWEVCIMKNEYPSNKDAYISFVNNINTYEGGEHVRYIYSQLSAFIQTKVPGVDNRRISNFVFVFVNATIEDPSFRSQLKEVLRTVPSAFGSVCQLDSRCLNVLKRNGVIEGLSASMQVKEMGQIRRDIGASKSKKITNIPHFTDARYAGTRKSKDCTLFIVEGASALELAEVGISLLGSDYYGCFAVKGKGINAGGGLSKVSNNVEFKNACRILGLLIGKEMLRKDLRYGRIVILTDADCDGIHIQALLIYWFRIFWKSLLEEDGFLYTMVTPIVVVSKGKQKLSERLPFYTQHKFDQWLHSMDEKERKKYIIKYYKGLGTSTAKEGRHYFKNLNSLLKKFSKVTQEDLDALDLVFDSKLASQRKDWLRQYDPKDVVFYSDIKELSYHTLVHKGMKHFSWMSMKRSIPHVVDGMTPSQRKCIFVFLKKNITQEMKVSQAMSDVDKETMYHHGQDSLGKAIVKMAQTFVGKQNINLLYPGGQYGTRKDGGKRFSADRYIFTKLSDITRYIFRKEDDDILRKQFDEGVAIEPVTMAPIIPMILVNGSNNPSTAYLSRVACHRPEELIKCIKTKLKTGSCQLPKPWYHKFKGVITPEEDGSFTSVGVVKQVNDTIWEVVELPVRTWRDPYKVKLNSMVDTKVIKCFYESHYGEDIKFEIHMNLDTKIDDPIEFFHLRTRINAQLNLFQTTGEVDDVKCYKTHQEIFDDFYEFRHRMYNVRKVNTIRILKESVPLLKAKCLFIESVVNGTIPIGKSKDVMYRHMEKLGIDEEFYTQLLQMSMSSLTKERIIDIKKDLIACNDRIKYYHEITVKKWWTDELVELELKLPKFWENRTVNLEED